MPAAHRPAVLHRRRNQSAHFLLSGPAGHRRLWLAGWLRHLDYPARHRRLQPAESLVSATIAAAGSPASGHVTDGLAPCRYVADLCHQRSGTDYADSGIGPGKAAAATGNPATAGTTTQE